MDKAVLYRVDSLLEHIELIFRDTEGLSFEGFSSNDLLFRATCFSLSQVGEMMNQLEKTLSGIYPDLPWLSARKMRNIIVHDYGGADRDIVYKTIKEDLPKLEEDFKKIKEEIN